MAKRLERRTPSELSFVVLISGGGTGGHLFPAVAIAQAIRQKAPQVRIEFVGSARGIEGEVVPKLGYRLHALPVSGLYRVGWRRFFAGSFRLAVSLLKAWAILFKTKPAWVIGVGGYASAPLMLARFLCRKPFFIQEQNFSPGIVNRFLGRRATTSFLAFPQENAFFSRSLVVGNPIREEIHALHAQAKKKPGKPLRLTVLGGSRGASAINEAMIACLRENPAFFRNAHVVHQSGADDLSRVCEAYENSGVSHEVRPFFEDVATLYSSSDLAVARAGSSVYEFLAAGLPSILIPYPRSSGEHQLRNARYLESLGASRLLVQSELNPQSLLLLLETFMRPEGYELLERMSAKAKANYRSNPALAIAEELFLNFLPE